MYIRFGGNIFSPAAHRKVSIFRNPAQPGRDFVLIPKPRKIHICPKERFLGQFLCQGAVTAEFHQESENKLRIFPKDLFKIQHTVTTFHLLDWNKE